MSFLNHVSSYVFYSEMNCVSLVILLFVRQIDTTYLLKLDAPRTFTPASYRNIPVGSGERTAEIQTIFLVKERSLITEDV